VGLTKDLTGPDLNLGLSLANPYSGVIQTSCALKLPTVAIDVNRDEVAEVINIVLTLTVGVTI
jgi:hypothetical protein